MQSPSVSVGKIWRTLLDGWPIFVAIGAVAFAAFNLWFEDAVDARVAVALPSHASIADIRMEMQGLQRDLEGLQDELAAGRIKGDIEANTNAIVRVESTVNRVEGKIDQFILLMTRD